VRTIVQQVAYRMHYHSEPDIVTRVDDIQSKVARVKEAIARVIFGQDSVIELVLVNILSGGHALLIGVPGLAKTSLVEALGAALGLNAKRIQFTPDLMPSDIVGTEVLEEKAGSRSFRFVEGPVFAQLLMADEINRASPKTQSALLQAMQEHQVTYAGHTYKLPAPFFVLATQNPLEQEGTYPLPEAQLDRFLLQVDVTYPDGPAERRMLFSTTGIEERRVQSVLTAEEVMAAQRLVRQIPAGDSVVDAILTLVRSARPQTAEAAPRVNELVAWGPGPRASQALMLTVRARALLDGRFAPSVEDVIALAKPVLRHRMALTFTARTENIPVDEVLDGLIARLH
jgi:MoxR-like ATPase